MSTTPTAVVGVGRAGIEVLNTIHAVAETNGDAGRFTFVGIDSDPETLERTPPGTTDIYLTINPAIVPKDRTEYPYLTDETDIPPEGAARHRGVGRYKLDARWAGRHVAGFPTHYATLRDAISDHFHEQLSGLGQQTVEFNIVHVHALSGGTGSGTFPLVAGMIDRIVDGLESDLVYMAGIGIVPNVLWGGEHDHVLPGPPECYPNAYAAFNDLEQLERLVFDPEVELELPVYTNRGEASNSDVNVDSFTFEDTSPFDDYWLVGIDEGGWPRSPRRPSVSSPNERAIQTTARTVHALTQQISRTLHWAMSQPMVGTFDRGTVSVPHQAVRAYCELKTERAEKRAREPEITAEIETAQSNREELRELRAGSADSVSDEATRDAVRRRIESAFDDSALVEVGSETEVERILDEVEDEFGTKGALLATELLRDRLAAADGRTPVEDDWRELVERIRSKYDLADRRRNRGDLDELRSRAIELKHRIDERIDEYADVVADWDPGVIAAIQDISPPVAGPFESEREAAERRLAELRDDRADLQRILSGIDRVGAMERAVDDRHQQLRARVRELLEEKDEEISRLRAERDALRTEIDRIQRDIASKRDELTESRMGRNEAVLPLIAEALEGLDVEFVETELDSLAAYVDHGLVDDRKVRRALGQWFELAQAWNNRIVDRDFEEAKNDQYYPDRDEMWVLYHQDNETLVDDVDLTSFADTTLWPGSSVQYRTDPYSVEFVSFSRRGPVSALEVYQRLDEMAETGVLDDFADATDTYDDYREAFAYPEWYGRWLRPFGGESVTLPAPPELDLDRVDRPSLDEAELKHFVRSTGLSAYLWKGAMWEYYESDDDEFTGWRESLRTNGVSFRDLQQSAPDPDLTGRWLAGHVDWEDVVDTYRENLGDETGLQFQFGEE